MEQRQVIYSEVMEPEGMRGGDLALALLVLLSAGVSLMLKALLDSAALPGGMIAVMAMAGLVCVLLGQRLACYRYSFDRDSFYAERITGRKAVLLARVPLNTLSLDPHGKGAKRVLITPNRKKTAKALLSRDGERETVYYADLSAEFVRGLEEAVQGLRV